MCDDIPRRWRIRAGSLNGKAERESSVNVGVSSMVDGGWEMEYNVERIRAREMILR
jgi:hypothetical protein